MACDALCDRGRYVVAGLHPVNEGMSKHMASKFKMLQPFVHDCLAAIASTLIGIPDLAPVFPDPSYSQLSSRSVMDSERTCAA